MMFFYKVCWSGFRTKSYSWTGREKVSVLFERETFSVSWRTGIIVTPMAQLFARSWCERITFSIPGDVREIDSGFVQQV